MNASDTLPYDWHDMLTAPRDGSHVVIADDKGNVAAAAWINDAWMLPYPSQDGYIYVERVEFEPQVWAKDRI